MFMSLGMWISYASINGESSAHSLCVRVALTRRYLALVLLRVWVLWGRRRAVLVGLGTAFLLYMAVTIGLIIWGTIVGGCTCVGYFSLIRNTHDIG